MKYLFTPQISQITIAKQEISEINSNEYNDNNYMNNLGHICQVMLISSFVIVLYETSTNNTTTNRSIQVFQLNEITMNYNVIQRWNDILNISTNIRNEMIYLLHSDFRISCIDLKNSMTKTQINCKVLDNILNIATLIFQYHEEYHSFTICQGDSIYYISLNGDVLFMHLKSQLKDRTIFDVIQIHDMLILRCNCSSLLQVNINQATYNISQIETNHGSFIQVMSQPFMSLFMIGDMKGVISIFEASISGSCYSKCSICLNDSPISYLLNQSSQESNELDCWIGTFTGEIFHVIYSKALELLTIRRRVKLTYGLICPVKCICFTSKELSIDMHVLFAFTHLASSFDVISLRLEDMDLQGVESYSTICRQVPIERSHRSLLNRVVCTNDWIVSHCIGEKVLVVWDINSHDIMVEIPLENVDVTCIDVRDAEILVGFQSGKVYVYTTNTNGNTNVNGNGNGNTNVNGNGIGNGIGNGNGNGYGKTSNSTNTSIQCKTLLKFEESNSCLLIPLPIISTKTRVNSSTPSSTHSSNQIFRYLNHLNKVIVKCDQNLVSLLTHEVKSNVFFQLDITADMYQSLGFDECDYFLCFSETKVYSLRQDMTQRNVNITLDSFMNIAAICLNTKGDILILHWDLTLSLSSSLFNLKHLLYPEDLHSCVNLLVQGFKAFQLKEEELVLIILRKYIFILNYSLEFSIRLSYRVFDRKNYIVNAFILSDNSLVIIILSDGCILTKTL